MSDQVKRGWKWAYKKLRGMHCSRRSAAYRAALYFVKGDTGSFICDIACKKIRIRR